jgi:O-antigen/teichoic acid export membrane protein
MNSQKKMMKTLFSSGLSGTISQVIVAATNLISLPILIASLGKSEYGIWVLIGFSFQFLAMSDLGIVNSVGRLVAKYKTEANIDSLRKLVSTVSILLVFVGIFIGACAYIVSFWISQALNIGPADQVIAQKLFLIGGLFLAITIPLRAGNGILSGYQKYSTINYSQSILSIINLSCIGLLSSTDQLGLVELVLIYSINTLLIELFRAYSALKLLKFRLSLKHF